MMIEGNCDTSVIVVKRNNSTCNFIDSVSGSFKLNRDWIEISEIDCFVEYCDIYLINWNMKNVAEIENGI